MYPKMLEVSQERGERFVASRLYVWLYRFAVFSCIGVLPYTVIATWAELSGFNSSELLWPGPAILVFTSLVFLIGPILNLGILLLMLAVVWGTSTRRDVLLLMSLTLFAGAISLLVLVWAAPYAESY